MIVTEMLTERNVLSLLSLFPVVKAGTKFDLFTGAISANYKHSSPWI